MTREEAIKVFRGFKFLPREQRAVEMAIKALEQEPCDDAETKKIDEWEIKGKNAELWIVKGNLQVRYLGTIHNISLPLVMPKPKTGHWIRMKAYEKWVCSECNTVFRFTFKEHDYCPNCGARMVESQETETWNGIHAQITAPKGTFDKIWEDAESEG